ncbi:hypothetical protein V500_01546 [Pseudogymnoascus sp. VKM F-4518 (FW-2643)]|nr:hypothetical protein V500_01546 [Pseudogymnoascus sp. VKM F-4518 (FW-2643)]
MAFLNPNDKPTLLKRPSDGDIGGDLRNREKHLDRGDEMRMLRDLYPNYDPTTAQKLNETQSAMDGWLVTMEKLGQTENIWEAEDIVNELLKSINNAGYNISTMLKERKIFDMKIRINRMVDSSQSQSTTVKQDRLFNFDLLLDKFEQLRKTIEKMATRLLRSDFDMKDIMKKLEEARSVFPDAAPLHGIPTRLDSRAMDVPAHKHDRTSPNDELEKHPSRPDAINSKPEREKDEVDKFESAFSSLPTMPASKEPENDKDVVDMWKRVANSLSTMKSLELEFDGESKADIFKLAAGYMSEIQPGHKSERALSGNDFITFQNEKYKLGINVLPLQQMERLLSGIPNAQAVALFVLIHLPEEYHAVLSCTTIFTEEHTPDWRGRVLFEEWSEEESDAFACEFCRLVHGSFTLPSVLRKWHELRPQSDNDFNFFFVFLTRVSSLGLDGN